MRLALKKIIGEMFNFITLYIFRNNIPPAVKIEIVKINVNVNFIV